MKKTKKTKAFSLIELSIIILIIGILIAGVTKSRSLIYDARIKAARTLSQSSPVAGIKGLILWMDVTKEGSLTNANASQDVQEGDFIDKWRDVNPQMNSKLLFSAPLSTNRPIYRASDLNGLPTLEFDGVENLTNGDYLSTPEEARIRKIDNHSIFVVFSPIDGNYNSDQGILVKLGSNNPSYSVMFHGNVNHYVGASVVDANLNQVSLVNTNPVYDQKSAIITTTHNADNVTDGFNIYINGSNVVTDNALSSIETSGEELRIGRQKNIATRACKCYISEIIMFNKVLKNEEKESVEKYLSQKWHIVLNN